MVAKAIAKKVKSNIRELEGVLNKIAAYTLLDPETFNMDKLHEILADLVEASPKKVLSIDSIIYEISKYYDIDPKIIKSNTRKQEFILISMA